MKITLNDIEKRLSDVEIKIDICDKKIDTCFYHISVCSQNIADTTKYLDTICDRLSNVNLLKKDEQ